MPVHRRTLLAGIGAMTLQAGCSARPHWGHPPIDPAPPPAPLNLTWWGTATVQLHYAGLNLLTDPAFDPAGSTYDFGPWYTPRSWFSSEKTYDIDPQRVSRPLDAVLLSHDHHADNLDRRGRELLHQPGVAKVVTTPAAAERLGVGQKAVGLPWGASTKLGGPRPVHVLSTPGLHGPRGLPGVSEVCGFLLSSPGHPTVWITGDTVWCEELEAFVEAYAGRIDILVVHCGGVAFPQMPVLGDQLYTFDSQGALALTDRVRPRAIVPVHHSGWTHFREPLAELRRAFELSDHSRQVLWPELGEPIFIAV